MILAFDTYYFESKAKTVCISFEQWSDQKPTDIEIEFLEDISTYEPGSFYKRELPCILSLLKRIDLSEVKYIIVDSFVQLDNSGKPGLGAYLYDTLDVKIPVIGVAKSSFHENTLHVKELTRGESKKPLYISCIGMYLNDAYKAIKSMHGLYRMPTLLQILDTLTKEKEE